jgi:5-methylcytosine-specific restriction endonuclease McrA
VSRTRKSKITLVGKLRHTEAEGLQVSYTSGSTTKWSEALPNAYEWPGIRSTKNLDVYLRALHANLSYRAATKELLELQRREPQRLDAGAWRSRWAYRDLVLTIDSDEPEPIRDKQKEAVMVKHFVLSRERDYERVRREVEALENLEKLDRLPREPIPESVRLFVWQRDGGQCVKCGSRARLEFDHIIPLAAGGSNTERNIQLLCEPCNRSKGSTI